MALGVSDPAGPWGEVPLPSAPVPPLPGWALIWVHPKEGPGEGRPCWSWPPWGPGCVCGRVGVHGSSLPDRINRSVHSTQGRPVRLLLPRVGQRQPLNLVAGPAWSPPWPPWPCPRGAPTHSPELRGTLGKPQRQGWEPSPHTQLPVDASFGDPRTPGDGGVARVWRPDGAPAQLPRGGGLGFG